MLIIRKIVSLISIFGLLIGSVTPCYADADNIVPAADEKSLRIDRLDNGADVVRINNPGDDGTSVNGFDKYNTLDHGTIISNNQYDLWVGDNKVTHNRNLYQEADRILFNVYSEEPSSLKGDTVIVGKNAEFIINNPNGIHCNGCGFINSRNVALKSEGKHSKIILDKMQADGSVNARGYDIELLGELGIKDKLSLDAMNIVDGSKLKSMHVDKIIILSDKSAEISGDIKAKSNVNIHAKDYLSLAKSIITTDEAEIFSHNDIDMSNSKIKAEKVKIGASENIATYNAKIKGQSVIVAGKNVNVDNSIIKADELNIGAANFRSVESEINAYNANIKTDLFISDFSKLDILNKLSFKSKYLSNGFSIINADTAYFDVDNELKNDFGAITTREMYYVGEPGSYLNNIGGTIYVERLNINVSNLFNYSDYKKGYLGEIKANVIKINSEYTENDGIIAAGKLLDINSAKVENKGTIKAPSLTINTTDIKSTGEIKGSNFYVVGDFEEVCSDEGICKYQVKENSNFHYNYIPGNNGSDSNGIMSIYAKSFSNNYQSQINHGIMLNLSGNTFTNTNLMHVMGDFLINDPGSFINYGKILVENGDMIINANAIISERFNPASSVDFDHYYGLGDDLSLNPWFYDLRTIAGSGSSGNMVFASNTSANFTGAAIKSEGSLDIIAPDGIDARLYFNENRHYGAPASSKAKIYMVADGSINMFAASGGISIIAEYVQSLLGDVNINAFGDINIESFSKFYTNPNQDPLNDLNNGDTGDRNSYWLTDGFEKISGINYPKGYPSVVQDITSFKADNGSIYLASTDQSVNSYGVYYDSNKFEVASNLTPKFHSIQWNNYQLWPSRWSFDLIGNTIISPEVKFNSNAGIDFQGVYVDNLNSINPLIIRARSNDIKIDISIDSFDSFYWGPNRSKKDSGPFIQSVVNPGKIISDKDIQIVSDLGNILIRGSVVASEGEVTLEAPNGEVDIISEVVTTQHEQRSTKKGLLGSKTTVHKWEDVDIYKAQLLGNKGVNIIAKKLLAIGADILAPDGTVNIDVPGGDVIFKTLIGTVTSSTEVNKKGFSISGIFGTLFEGKDKPNVSSRSSIRIHQVLPDVGAIMDMASGQSITDLAPLIKGVMSAFKLSNDFAEKYKNNNGNAVSAAGNVVLDQLGFKWSENGLYIVPKGVGVFTSNYKLVETNDYLYHTMVNGKVVDINADTLVVSGGSEVYGQDDVIIDADTLIIEAGTQRSTKEEQFEKKKVLVNTTLDGGSSSYTKSYAYDEIESKVYSYIRSGNDTHIDVVNLVIEGGGIYAPNNNVDADNLFIKTLKNTYSHKDASQFVSGSIGLKTGEFSAQFNQSKGKILDESVSDIAGIRGVNVVVNSDNAYLVGGVIAGSNSTTANIANLTHEDVDLKHEEKRHGYGIDVGGNFKEPWSIHNTISGFLSLFAGNAVSGEKHHVLEEGVIHSTSADTSVDGINHDVNKIEEWESVKDDHYSIYAPVPTQAQYEEIKDKIETVGKLFSIAKEESVIKSDIRDDYHTYGLNKEADEYARSILGNESDLSQDNQGNINRVDINEPNYVGSESLNVLAEYFGGYSEIPEHILNDKRIFYINEEGNLRNSSDSEIPKGHELISKFGYSADNIINVVDKLTDKYGTAYEVAMYAALGMAKGTAVALSTGLKNFVGAEAFGEYIARGADYAIGVFADKLKYYDPYLSDYTARNIAAVAIAGSIISTGVTADTKLVMQAVKGSTGKVNGVTGGVSTFYNKQHGNGGGSATKHTVDLKHHEGGANKGHALERHIEITDTNLKQRIADNYKTITGSSRFYDKKTAEMAIEKALHNSDFDHWLKNTELDDFKLTDYNVGFNVGYGYDRKQVIDMGIEEFIKNAQPKTSQKISVIIKRVGESYKIITAFPSMK